MPGSENTHPWGGDEILAAFVAGAVLNGSYRKVKVAMRHERFRQALGRFFDLPIMIVFGAASASFNAMLIEEQTGLAALRPVISVAVAASVLAHGIRAHH